MFEKDEIGRRYWYAIARRFGRWTVERFTDYEATWLGRHNCEIEGPFPIRDIARLAVGYRLSRHHKLATLHGDDLTYCLMRYGMTQWPALNLARAVDERTAPERTAIAVEDIKKWRQSQGMFAPDELTDRQECVTDAWAILGCTQLWVVAKDEGHAWQLVDEWQKRVGHSIFHKDLPPIAITLDQFRKDFLGPKALGNRMAELGLPGRINEATAKGCGCWTLDDDGRFVDAGYIEG